MWYALSNYVLTWAKVLRCCIYLVCLVYIFVKLNDSVSSDICLLSGTTSLRLPVWKSIWWTRLVQCLLGRPVRIYGVLPARCGVTGQIYTCQSPVSTGREFRLKAMTWVLESRWTLCMSMTPSTVNALLVKLIPEKCTRMTTDINR